MTFFIALDWGDRRQNIALKPTRKGVLQWRDEAVLWTLDDHVYLSEDGRANFRCPPPGTALLLPPSTRFELTTTAEIEGDPPMLWVVAYGEGDSSLRKTVSLAEGVLSFTTPDCAAPVPIRLALRLHGAGRLGRLAARLRERAAPTALSIGPWGGFRTPSPFHSPAGHMPYGQRHHSFYDERPASWYDAFVGDIGPCQSLLDIGAGPGLLVDAARSRGIPEVLGVERDAHFLAMARKAGRNLVAHDLNDPMPFLPSRSRDAVTAHQVFDYLDRTALWSTVREAARILRIGGLLKFRMRTDGRASGDETRAPRLALTKRRFEEAGFDLVEFKHSGNGLRGTAVLARDAGAWPVSENGNAGLGPFTTPTVCLPTGIDAWDDAGDRDFTVVTDERKHTVVTGGRIHAVYTGYHLDSEGTARAIMLAESSDGIAWDRTSPRPVLAPDSGDPDEAGGLAAGSVIAGDWPDGRYALFYSCRSAEGVWPGIRLAFSDDLRLWRRHPGWVLHRTQFQGLRHLALADVVRTDDGKWLMHCEGWIEGGGWAVFQARSMDGLDWQPSRPTAMVAPPIFSWAGGHVANPKCFEAESGKLLLGVNASPGDLRFRLALLESEDGATWRPTGPAKLLSPTAGQYRIESLFTTPQDWTSGGRLYFFAAATRQTQRSSRSLTAARSQDHRYLGQPWTADEPSLFLVHMPTSTLRVLPAGSGLAASARRTLPGPADVRLAGRIVGAPSDAGVGFAGKGRAAILVDARGRISVGTSTLFQPDQQPGMVAFAMTLAGRLAGRPELIVRLWLDGVDVVWLQVPLQDADIHDAVVQAGSEGPEVVVEYLDLWAPEGNEDGTVGDAHVYGGTTGDADPLRNGPSPRDFLRILADQRVDHALLVPFGTGALDTFGQLADLAKRHPDRFSVLHRVPAAFNAPDMIGYQLDQLELLWQEGLLSGLKVHTAYEALPPPPVLDWLAERCLLLMVHARSAADIASVGELARQSPVPVLLSHFGGYPADRRRYEAAIGLMRECPNVFLVTSMVWLTHYLREACLSRPAQVLLGSDYPASAPTAAAAVAAAKLPPEVFTMVAGGTLRFLMDRIVRRRRMMMVQRTGLRLPCGNTGADAPQDLADTARLWARHITDITRSLGATSILEWSVEGAGRAILDGPIMDAGLERHMGDAGQLAPHAFDLVFTGLFPPSGAAVPALLRSARRFALFVEPMPPDEDDPGMRAAPAAARPLAEILRDEPRVERVDTRPLCLRGHPSGPRHRQHLVFLKH